MARKARSLLAHMHVIDDEEKLVDMALALEPQPPRPSPSISAISALESSSVSFTSSSSVSNTTGNSGVGPQGTSTPPVRSKEPPLVSVTPAAGGGNGGGPVCAPGSDSTLDSTGAPKLGLAPQVVVHASGPLGGGGATGAILSKLSNLGEFILRAISPTHGQRLNTVVRRPKPLISIGSTPQVLLSGFRIIYNMFMSHLKLVVKQSHLKDGN